MERIADKLRPTSLDEIVGQEYVKNILSKQVQSGTLSNLLLYGESGCGKTTLATVISKSEKLNMSVSFINASNSKLSDLKDALKENETLLSRDKKRLIIVDEIHMYTKRELSILLDYLEKGRVTLIGLTTENPFSTLPQGITSRCLVLKLNQLTKEDIVKGIRNSIKKLSELDKKEITISDENLEHLINLYPKRDMRQILNIIEAILYSKFYHFEDVFEITFEDIRNISKAMSLEFESDETILYNLISALQKSIRNSDVDASLYYLGRVIYSGSNTSLELLLRRLAIIAFEDISNANINALLLTVEGIKIVREIGIPESTLILSTIVTLLALSPKSNASYLAIKNVMSDIEQGHIYDVPNHLKNRNKQPNGQKYIYPHDYPNGYVYQQCLPDELINRRYFYPKENTFEWKLYERLNLIKNNSLNN